MTFRGSEEEKRILTLRGRLRDCGLLHPIEVICADRGVTVDDLLGRGRHKSLAHCRALVWAWLERKCHKSQMEIAILFDRDSTTVCKVLGKHRKMGFIDPIPG